MKYGGGGFTDWKPLKESDFPKKFYNEQLLQGKERKIAATASVSEPQCKCWSSELKQHKDGFWLKVMLMMET